MLYVGLVLGSLICAFQAIRSARMMFAAIWLACTSALVAALLYAMGAREIAIIELSVGAGLVTVLFAFTLSFIGENVTDSVSVIPRPLVLALMLHVMVFLIWLAFPPAQAISATAGPSFSEILWQGRSLDVLGQIALIFVGILAVLGLLVEFRTPILTARQPIFRRQHSQGGAHVEPPQAEFPETTREAEEKSL